MSREGDAERRADLRPASMHGGVSAAAVRSGADGRPAVPRSLGRAVVATLAPGSHRCKTASTGAASGTRRRSTHRPHRPNVCFAGRPRGHSSASSCMRASRPCRPGNRRLRRHRHAAFPQPARQRPAGCGARSASWGEWLRIPREGGQRDLPARARIQSDRPQPWTHDLSCLRVPLTRQVAECFDS